MIGLLTASPGLLVLPLLALASGVDLYLTLLFLGLAPTLGWWTSLPGTLGDLNSPGVLAIVGTFYALELLAERWPSGALIWNAFHAIIRPLAGALLALLLLDGQPSQVRVGGAMLAGLLAAAAHATRTGGGVLQWLDAARHPNRLLVALLEDVCVLGAVTLLLDAPRWSLVAAILVIAASLPHVRAQVRAFAFAVRLVWGRVWGTLGQPRWDDPDEFPGWVRSALQGDAAAPDGGLRGSPSAAHRLPDAPRFATGWVVVRGDSALFVHRTSPWRTKRVDLAPLRAVEVSQSAFFRRVKFRGGGSPNLYIGLDGPGVESLRAEFMFG